MACGHTPPYHSTLKSILPRAFFVSLIAMGFGLSGSRCPGQEKGLRNHVLPNNPAAAWSEAEKVYQALQPPQDWRTDAPTSQEHFGWLVFDFSLFELTTEPIQTSA